MNGDQLLIRTAMANGNLWFIDKAMSCRRLWSIGNYNYRFFSMPIKKQLDRYIRDAIGDLIFDNYTDGRFHEWIIRSVANTLLAVAIQDQSIMESALEKMNLTEEILLYGKSNIKLKYYLKIHFPTCYAFLKKIKSLRKKRNA